LGRHALGNKDSGGAETRKGGVSIFFKKNDRAAMASAPLSWYRLALFEERRTFVGNSGEVSKPSMTRGEMYDQNTEA